MYPWSPETRLRYKNSIGQRHRVRDSGEASIRCQRTVAAGSKGLGGCPWRVQANARVRASWIPPVTAIGKTKPSCGRSVARIRAADRREAQDLHPGGSMRWEHAGGLPPSLRMASWGGGRSLAGAALFLERGSVYPILGGKRPSLLLPTPLRAGAGYTGGQDAEGLGPEELRPRRSDVPRRRPQTPTSQHVRDRRGRDRDAEIEQLALDPEVAPSGILPGHLKDQVANLGIDGGTSWPSTSPGRLPAHELPAPAGEGVRTDRKGGPPLAGEEPAGRGQEGPVGRAVAWSLPPPAQDPQLMAQHGDLQVPIIDAHADEQAKQPAQEAIQEEREHERSLTDSQASQQRRMSTAGSNLFTPQALADAVA